MQTLGVPDGAGQEYFDEEMPRLIKELADVLPVEEKLCVVVDEAQDFAPLWWETCPRLNTHDDDGACAFEDGRENTCL